MGSAASALPTVDRADRAWDASFAGWRPGPGSTLLRTYSDAVNKHLLERWLPAKSSRILKTDLFDEAVGPGLVGLLLERGDRVCGIDVAPSVVAAARAAHPRLEAAVADVRALPYADGAFDVVVSTSTLDHFDRLEDIAEALKELHRVLRPGGSLIVTLDNSANPLVAIRNALPYALLHRSGLVPYPTGTTCGPTGLSRLVERAGFHVGDVDSIMHVPRLAVRSVGQALAAVGFPRERLVSALVRVEPARRRPLRLVSGQFVAVRATRPPAGVTERTRSPRGDAPAAAGIVGPRVLTMRVLGRTVYRRLEWMELPLDPPGPVIEADVPLDVAFLGEADTTDIAVLCRDVGSAEITARFSRGDRCLGARHDGWLVAVSWVATAVAPVDYLRLAVRLPAGTAYVYGLWTDPGLRGLKIAPSMTSRLRGVLAAEGYRATCAAVLTENRAAVRHLGRAGYRRAGVIGWVGVGPMRRFFRRLPHLGRQSYS